MQHEPLDAVPQRRVGVLPARAERVQAFRHHDGYFGVTGEDNLFVRAQNGVRLALTAALVSTAQFDVDYDRSPAPGRVSTDRSVAFTLGYRF